MKLKFLESKLCKSGWFCPKCRDREGGRKARINLANGYELPIDAPDFACPYGIPWGGACRRCGGKHPIAECPIQETLEEAAAKAKGGGCCDPPQA